MMTRAATYVIAVSLGAIALSLVQTPPPPPWVVVICADASPCALPGETYQGIALAIQWLEDDGQPCLEPGEVLPVGAHPQSACDSDTPGIAHWFAFTRGATRHDSDDATSHDVFVATSSPIYSGGNNELPSLGQSYAYGAVMALTLPTSTVQAAWSDALEAMVDDKIAAAIAAIPPADSVPHTHTIPAGVTGPGG